jgi:hypothetical protein
LLLAGAICPTLAQADTHYVSKSGSNTYPYDSWATAADTVARAVEAVGEWDTIRIAAGHFVTDTIRMKKGQVILGLSMDSTILDSMPHFPLDVIVGADSCIVSSLSFVGPGPLPPAADAVSARALTIGAAIVLDSVGSFRVESVKCSDLQALMYADLSGTT